MNSFYIDIIDTIDNDSICYYFNDQPHREDGFAFDNKYVSLWHYKGNGHRLDGPASINIDGNLEWFYHGEHIKCSSQEEFDRIIKLMHFK